MKIEDYKNLWQDLGNSVEQNWKLDMDALRQENLDKASHKLKNLFRVKLFILCFFLAVFAYLAMLIVKYLPTVATIATLASFEFWTFMVICVLIYELFLINKFDYNDPLPKLLKCLSLIKLSTIRLLRVGTLILPFNTILLSYYIIFEENMIGVIIQNGLDWPLTFSLVFSTLISIWSFRKISPKNAKKKWMYKLLRGNGSQVMDAIYFMNQIRSIEKNDSVIKKTVDNNVYSK
ncbi:hypothetical protein [Aquimarina algiphila]|uniref:hypothetical protein n=1 Tax=Aquimarina algiphila TaxID=2047982 RepID=UPI00232B6B5B|nr:hypothetical protein [Aquimarina algiphila]